MDFIQELETKKVLSKKDIVLLKEYISEKYIDYSKIQKSNILANAVHQVLDKNILGLKKEYNQIIKQDLLKNTLLKEGQDILLIDILNCCISLKDPSNDFSENILKWVNLHVENKVSQTDLEKYNLELSALKEDSIVPSPIEEYVEDTMEAINYHDKKDSVEENTKNTDKVKINNKYDETITHSVLSFIERTKYFCLTYSKNFSMRAIQSYKDFILAIKLKNTIPFRRLFFISSFFIVFVLFFYNHYNTNNVFEYKKVLSGTSSSLLEGIERRTKTVNSINGVTTEANLNTTLSSNLPEYFKYKAIDQQALKNFLMKQNSLLAEEPYFSTILSVSKEHNLNPFVLFAITGQEQGFVPKENSFSLEIANNPFNVYGSWKEYNTDIEDASRIVCHTIINLSEDRPQDAEPFQWINRKYAEDQNWFKGVSELYNELEENNRSLVNAIR